MMGGVSPKTFWASYKYGIINFDTLLHLVGLFCMNCSMMHGSTNIKREELYAKQIELLVQYLRLEQAWLHPIHLVCQQYNTHLHPIFSSPILGLQKYCPQKYSIKILYAFLVSPIHTTGRKGVILKVDTWAWT